MRTRTCQRSAQNRHRDRGVSTDYPIRSSSIRIDGRECRCQFQSIYSPSACKKRSNVDSRKLASASWKTLRWKTQRRLIERSDESRKGPTLSNRIRGEIDSRVRDINSYWKTDMCVRDKIVNFAWLIKRTAYRSSVKAQIFIA